MGEEAAEGEPIYLELVDALELHAAIIGGTVTQASRRRLRPRPGSLDPRSQRRRDA